MRRRVSRFCSLVTLMALAGVVPARADVIDASQLIGALEVGYRPMHPIAVGQTVTVPDGATTLTTFDIWMGLNAMSGFSGTLLPFDARAFVQRWTESAPNFGSTVGNVLATSAPLRVDQPSSRSGLGSLHRFNFTLDTPVTPRDRYLLFVSAFGLTDGHLRAGFALGRTGLSFTPTIGTDYAGGHIVTGEIVGSDATQSNWCRGGGCNSQNYDLAFIARFDERVASTPEPAAVLLLGSGMMAIAWQRRRARLNHLG